MGKRDEGISAFAELLRFHFRNGTRPDGRPGELGRIWNNKRLGDESGVSARTIRNWLQGKTLPTGLESIERAFFGGTPIYDSERRQLRELYAAAMNARYPGAVTRNQAFNKQVTMIKPKLLKYCGYRQDPCIDKILANFFYKNDLDLIKGLHWFI